MTVVCCRLMLVGDYLRRGVAEFVGTFAGGAIAAIVYNWLYLRPEAEPALGYVDAVDA